MTLAIGLISGTSMDGIDVALVREGDTSAAPPEVVAFATVPFPEQVRVALRRCQREGRLVRGAVPPFGRPAEDQDDQRRRLPHFSLSGLKPAAGSFTRVTGRPSLRM